MNPPAIMAPDFIPTLLPLVTAHLIGDFVLQTKEDVARKHRPLGLLRHVCIVTATSYVLLGVPQAWLAAAAVFTTHLVIDYLKIRAGKDDLTVFATDQLAHLVALALIGVFAARPASESLWIVYAGHDYYALLALIGGVIATIQTGAIVIGKTVVPFLAKLDAARSTDFEPSASRGFDEGGRLIGQLERALVFLFVLMDQITAIGFLIAAKSILRFGEVKDRTNRMEAEYIIIGTLSSFLWALVVAYVTRWVLRGGG